MKPKRSQAKPKRYPSDLTRTQWKRLKRLLPQAKPGGRPRSVNLREVLNGIFYITRGGCAWRMMPKDLPPWSTCYDYFRKWRNDGTWSRINDALRTQVRHQRRAAEEPEHGHHRQPERQDHRAGRPARQGRRTRRSTAGSGTWSWTRWGWSWRRWSTRRASRTGTGPSWSWRSWWGGSPG